MTVTSLQNLLDRELQEARGAETLILSLLPKLKEVASQHAAEFDACAARTQQRLKRLDQIGQAAADVPADVLRLGVLSKIDDYISTVANRDALWAIAHAEFLAARYSLLARYALLSSCADRLHRPDISAVADLALTEERASLGSMVSPEDREGDRYKGISMGERLTSFFERKK